MSRDSGAAPERTALAWDRTAVAIVCGAIVIARLGYDRLGVASFLSVAVALPLALACVMAGSPVRRRRDGRRPAAVAAATALIAAVEVAALVR